MKEYEWVVYAKRPFAGPQQVLDYVRGYTHRVAISNNRLIAIANGRVQFHWKDYRDNSTIKVMDLEADEFIRRFLLHVLQKLALCRQLLGMQTSSKTTSIKDYHQPYEELTGRSLTLCPRCLKGQMMLVESLPPAHSCVLFPVDSS